MTHIGNLNQFNAPGGNAPNGPNSPNGSYVQMPATKGGQQLQSAYTGLQNAMSSAPYTPQSAAPAPYMPAAPAPYMPPAPGNQPPPPSKGKRPGKGKRRHICGKGHGKGHGKGPSLSKGNQPAPPMMGNQPAPATKGGQAPLPGNSTNAFLGQLKNLLDNNAIPPDQKLGSFVNMLQSLLQGGGSGAQPAPPMVG